VKLLKGRIGKIGLAILAVSLIATLGVGVFASTTQVEAGCKCWCYGLHGIDYICCEENGIHVTLNAYGLQNGLSRKGANQIAADCLCFYKRATGHNFYRSKNDVANEIIWHCRAYKYNPFLRNRANPIDIMVWDSRLNGYGLW